MLPRLFDKKIIFSIIFFLLSSSATLAQTIPDATLGNESSTINTIDELRSRVEGGAIRGENLFHSFEEFGISEGLEVFFANPENINNIISRVTGNNISEILGTLGVEGAANLFLINPNGIVFGENAVVDVGGSFIATTAENIEFEDGSTWNIRDRNSKPLLTWNAPIGLGLEETSGSILVKGSGHSLVLRAFEPVLKLPNENGSISGFHNIALIGNNVKFDGGIVEVENSQIDIISLKQGNINFNLARWNFSNGENIQLADISLEQKALLNSNSSIKLTGKTITIGTGSLVLSQNQSFEPSRGIEVNSNKLEVIDVFIERRPDGTLRFIPSAIITESLNRGSGGDISINTANISVGNAGQIFSTSFGEGKGGDISIEADSISAFGSLVNVFSSIRSVTFSSSDGGNLRIVSENLSLIDGGSINSATFNSGNAGNLDLNISDTTNISGFVLETLNPSSIISASLSEGNTGTVNLNTAKLHISNTGNVSSLATSSGSASDISVNASQSIRVENRVSDVPILASAIASSAEVVPPNLVSAFGIPTEPSGDAGNLTVTTPSLKIFDGGIVAVRNTGLGNGGELIINANTLDLQSRGEISASTTFGQGGNINLKSDRVILENAQITASAGDSGDGGNITIDAETFLALGDSDITATAVRGDGGDITISAEGLLGISERPAQESNGTSDIDASSEFGEEGTITIISPQINNRDPIIALRGIEPADNQEEIDYKCDRNLLKNQRGVYVGRTNIESLAATEENYFPTPGFVPPEEETNIEEEEFPVWQQGDPIIDSNAIRVDEKGDIYFVAEISPKQVRDLMCSSNQAELEREEK